MRILKILLAMFTLIIMSTACVSEAVTEKNGQTGLVEMKSGPDDGGDWVSPSSQVCRVFLAGNLELGLRWCGGYDIEISLQEEVGDSLVVQLLLPGKRNTRLWESSHRGRYALPHVETTLLVVVYKGGILQGGGHLHVLLPSN